MQDDDMNVEIDTQKLKRMIIQIYAKERENSKTNEFSDGKMMTEIEDIIKEEADKCY